MAAFLNPECQYVLREGNTIVTCEMVKGRELLRNPHPTAWYCPIRRALTRTFLVTLQTTTPIAIERKEFAFQRHCNSNDFLSQAELLASVRESNNLPVPTERIPEQIYRIFAVVR
jgi:hypothetical protein